MKTATQRFYRRALLLLTAGVLLLGTSSIALAGDGKRIVRTRHAAQTQQVSQRDTGASATPRPVVDETPINPEHATTNTPPKSSDSNRKKPPVRRR